MKYIKNSRINYCFLYIQCKFHFNVLENQKNRCISIYFMDTYFIVTHTSITPYNIDVDKNYKRGVIIGNIFKRFYAGYATNG